MKKAMYALQDCAYLLYLVGMLTLAFLPVLVGIGLTLLAIAVWLGAFDWPIWGRVLYTMFGVASYAMANDMSKELPNKVTSINRRWNSAINGSPSPRAMRVASHDQRRQLREGRHIRLIKPNDHQAQDEP